MPPEINTDSEKVKMFCNGKYIGQAEIGQINIKNDCENEEYATKFNQKQQGQLKLKITSETRKYFRRLFRKLDLINQIKRCSGIWQHTRSWRIKKKNENRIVNLINKMMEEMQK
jgi:hypothetical protein